MDGAGGKAEIAFRMNLNSLKRLDPYVTDIVARASHVVLYAHSVPSSQFPVDSTVPPSWDKQEVEGTLFITKR